MSQPEAVRLLAVWLGMAEFEEPLPLRGLGEPGDARLGCVADDLTDAVRAPPLEVRERDVPFTVEWDAQVLAVDDVVGRLRRPVRDAEFD